jgi:hypothetical protein
MDKEDFMKRTGRAPVQDDLERVNCPEVGKVCHFWCGWCVWHDRPRFECGCAMITAIDLAVEGSDRTVLVISGPEGITVVDKDFVLLLERMCCPLLQRST